MKYVDGVMLISMSVFFFLFLRVVWKEHLEKLRKKKGIILSDTKPDDPFNFGTDAVWFAVKTNDTARVAATLGIRNAVKSNWNNAHKHILWNSIIYITPPLKGWVLITGKNLPANNDEENMPQLQMLLKKLSIEFGEAQYFANTFYYYSFAKSLNGVIYRLYAYNENSYAYDDIGHPDIAESRYNFPRISPWEIDEEDQDYWERNKITFLSEEILLKIAEKWSINPMKLTKYTDSKGLGILGFLN